MAADSLNNLSRPYASVCLGPGPGVMRLEDGLAQEVHENKDLVLIVGLDDMNIPRGDSFQLGRGLVMKNAGGQGEVFCRSQIFIKLPISTEWLVVRSV